MSNASDITPALTPEMLLTYVLNYTHRAEQDGSNQLYPTFRQVAKRFNVTYDQIEDVCADWDNSQGYMAVVFGGQCNGGHFSYDHRGQQLVAYQKCQSCRR